MNFILLAVDLAVIVSKTKHPTGISPLTTTIDLPYFSDNEHYFEAIKQLPDAIWFDSGKPRSLRGRFDIISAQPSLVVETCGGSTIVQTTAQQQSQYRTTENPFRVLEKLYLEYATKHNDPKNHQDQLLPFTGGLAGYFGYDLGRHLEDIPHTLNKVDGLPDMRVGRYHWACISNHTLQKSYLVFDHTCTTEQQQSITQLFVSAAQTNATILPTVDKAVFASSMEKAKYLAAVERIQQYLLAGDCYQVNLARHFSAPYTGDHWALYRHLRRLQPSPYSSFYQLGESSQQSILCLSPERFLKLSKGQVETKPIKGTMPRGADLATDERNAITLQNSQKDRAENLMIVDLLRNDLGKSCTPGSIRVPKLFALESFPNVHHLVSTIVGTLAPSQTPLSLLENCFPGGSITGAPKKRAMEIIEELETCQRSIYCGSMGYISHNGRMDTNIVIRTLVADGETLHCWGGGGIVTDSQPQHELQEITDKIHALINFSA